MTSVLNNSDFETLKPFVESLIVMANSLELKSLSLSHNFFEDQGIEVITGQVLTLMPKLKEIDISANKITDYGM